MQLQPDWPCAPMDNSPIITEPPMPSISSDGGIFDNFSFGLTL